MNILDMIRRAWSNEPLTPGERAWYHGFKTLLFGLLASLLVTVSQIVVTPNFNWKFLLMEMLATSATASLSGLAKLASANGDAPLATSLEGASDAAGVVIKNEEVRMGVAPGPNDPRLVPVVADTPNVSL